MNIDNSSENSDSSDEDYVPDAPTKLPSEEDSDGSVEDSLADTDALNISEGKKRKKRSWCKKKPRTKSPSPVKAVEDTKSTDDLWADFKKDTGFKTRAERVAKPICKSNNINVVSTPINSTFNNSTKANTAEAPKTVKVTEVYTFAGEEVKVEKDISVASVSKMTSRNTPKSGLQSVLSNLGKKSKISTLEKSKLDWDQFKKEEKIEDELHAYSKSKDGYLERQDFLQRADLRRFEIEKDMRSTIRSNRTNN